MRYATMILAALTLAACAGPRYSSRTPEQARFESWVATCRAAGATQPGWCAAKMLEREQKRAEAATAARYQEQEDFDQWAASCKNAESYNPARCAATMHTIQKRR